MKPKPGRRSIRLAGYDYTLAGAYFVTICTWNKEILFGDVRGDEMRLNEFGRVVWDEWERTEVVRSKVSLDAFVVMPNHVHGIVVIRDVGGGKTPTQHTSVGAQRAATLPANLPNVKPGSLGAIVRAFKSAVTRRINIMRHTPGAPVWQRNYYDRIIRDEVELNNIRLYIESNPGNWKQDEQYPGNFAVDV